MDGAACLSAKVGQTGILNPSGARHWYTWNNWSSSTIRRAGQDLAGVAIGTEEYASLKACYREYQPVTDISVPTISNSGG